MKCGFGGGCREENERKRLRNVEVMKLWKKNDIQYS